MALSLTTQTRLVAKGSAPIAFAPRPLHSTTASRQCTPSCAPAERVSGLGSSVPRVVSRTPKRSVAAFAGQSTGTSETTVEQMMIKKPICFTDTMAIKDAVKTMLEKNISGGPVVDASGALVGIISESDVIWKGVGAPLDHYLIPPTYISILDAVIQLRDQRQILDEEQKILSRTVGQAMTKEVVSIEPSATLTAAAALMVSRKINRLPVVSGNKVVGLVTRHDVLKAIYDSKSFM